MKRAHDMPDARAVALSGRIYQQLLAGYPPEYRREYGPAMAQLFRDQCRDAWRCGRGWGLLRLWLRVLPDLIKTSVLEHISTLNGRKTMMERISAVLPPQSAPRRVFVAVFGAVFLLAVATSTLITFVLPELYSSTARVKVEQDPGEVNRSSNLPQAAVGYDPYFLKTQFELIESEVILGKVVNDLDLNRAWAKKYGGGNPLRPAETIALLKSQIHLHPVRNTSLIEIRVFSQEASEAAKLANAIARTYQEHNAARNRPYIVDAAVPGLMAVRPNRPLNITLGILGGALLALVTGAGLAGIAWRLRRGSGTAGSRPPTGEGVGPTAPLAGRPPAKNILDRVTGLLWTGIGGLLFGVALIFLLWFLTLRQAEVTAELLALPFWGLIWGGNAVLGCLLFQGKRWARICLGVEGVLLLTYYCFRYGFVFPNCPAWVFNAVIHSGWFMVEILPHFLRWVFIPLGFISICALLWPSRSTAPSLP